ncbi:MULTISPECIES: thioredoxin [Brenneria]|uniref:Thioredoxin n=1 Tax=Brenneria nigrifluens DSM 30175 = ATCC 13028 TaxID=1121120 RepID=A0A2U1UWT6_9GAMM|nr:MULTISPECIES: thioredoxin [Brenneria]EHD22545.1 thioredoxin [Brenneria sp. EniD312]PWC26080.1 thioredoxin [Brenneria nigrifluens] [Brenneria nigrifluens DSM 30175 = ATCC 13028]QCR05535.1 thioredoxin [Brenneria nigrifluens] [Brenneria nigrifluens DSM 30175 = ATCC 13028]
MSDVIITASDATLDNLLKNSDKPVLLDLWAPWCQPCKTLAPLLEALADNTPDDLTVAKLNVEQYPDLMRRFGVRGIPTLLLFKDGREISRQIGVKTLPQLRGWLASHQITVQQNAQPVTDAAVSWGAFYGDASLHAFLHQRLRQHAADGEIAISFSPYWQENKGTISAAFVHCARIEVFERVTGLPASLALLLENLTCATPRQVDALFDAVGPGKAVGDIPLQWLHLWLGDAENPWSDWLTDRSLDDLRRQWRRLAARQAAGETVAESEWARLHQQATARQEKAGIEQGLEKNIAALLAILSPPPAPADAASWQGIKLYLGFALAEILRIEAGWSNEERATPDKRHLWFKKHEAAAPGKRLTDERIAELRARWLQENPEFSAKEDEFYRQYPSLQEQQKAPLQEKLWRLLRNAPLCKPQPE